MADPMSIAMIAASVGSTIMQASAQATAAKAAAQEGAARQQAAEYEAQQQRVKAGQERAASQQRLQVTRKQERLIQSQLQARAAASGGGATDPGIITLSGDIAKEGEYRALQDLYIGEERARSLEQGADLSSFEGAEAMRAGKARERAGYMQAAGTLLGGAGSAGSLYGKYYPEGGSSTLNAPRVEAGNPYTGTFT